MLLIGDTRQRTCAGVTRRAFVQAGVLGALGLALPERAALAGAVAPTGRARVAGQVDPHVGSVSSRIRGSHPVLSSFVVAGERLHQGHRPIQVEGGGILGAVYDPFRVRYDPEDGVLLGEVT